MRLSEAVFAIICLVVPAASGQTPEAPKPVPTPTVPLTVSLKKSTVVFQTTCLIKLDIAAELINISKLNPEQLATLETQLNKQLSAMNGIDQFLSTAIPKRGRRVSPEESRLIEMSAQIPDQQKLTLLAKLIDLSDDDLQHLSPLQLASVPAYPVWGTGFFVSVGDERLKPDEGFLYLVTNRHVAQPGVDKGNLCSITTSSILMNRQSGKTETINLGRLVNWTYSSDASVDVAVVPFSIAPDKTDPFDVAPVPESLFVTEEMIKSQEVIEGDPVLFAGLFIQTFRELHRLEPIVRSGTLAMVPQGKMLTVLNLPGDVFLADLHSYGGNSGSPVVVDIARFKGGTGYNFKFLGLISGEIFEDANFTMQITTTYGGTTTANSGVSIVVPAQKIREIIHSDQLKAFRDATIKQLGR
jgi:hypothetical protein